MPEQAVSPQSPPEGAPAGGGRCPRCGGPAFALALRAGRLICAPCRAELFPPPRQAAAAALEACNA